MKGHLHEENSGLRLELLSGVGGLADPVESGKETDPERVTGIKRKLSTSSKK